MYNCVTLASVLVTSCGPVLPTGHDMAIRERSMELWLQALCFILLESGWVAVFRKATQDPEGQKGKECALNRK